MHPKLLAGLTCAGTLAFLAVPAQHAMAVSPSTTVQIMCDRTTDGPAFGPNVWFQTAGADADSTATFTGSVRFNDGTSAAADVYSTGGDQVYGQASLRPTQIPTSVTITENGVSRTFQVTPGSNCALPKDASKYVQTIVCGTDNDLVTLPDGLETESDTGWVAGKRTIQARATWEGGWMAIPYQGTTRDPQVAQAVTYTFTDGGNCTTKTVTTTKTVPVYGPRTTCTDPTVGTFQVDAYRPSTTAMVNTIKANSARNSLPYRFDGPNAPQLKNVVKSTASFASLWGHSSYQFVTLRLSDVTRAGSLAAAINAKTTTIPNIGGTAAVGKTYVTAWKLASGATTVAPWTSNPSTAASKAQTEWDAVTLPKAVCTTKTVQTGTKKVTSTSNVVVAPATPAAQIAPYVLPRS